MPAERFATQDGPPVEKTAPKGGIIAIILRPSENNDGTYAYYCFDHNHYTELQERKKVLGGVGLMSETYWPDEDPDHALARCYVEEVLGIDPAHMTEDEFEAFIAQAAATVTSRLRLLGEFTHAFNSKDRSRYHEDPTHIGAVRIFADDDRVMPVGELPLHPNSNQVPEVVYSGYLREGDLDHRYIQYRTGYDTRYLLGSLEVAEIFEQHGIIIEK